MTTDDSRDFEDADTLSPVPKSDQRDDSREQAIEQAAERLREKCQFAYGKVKVSPVDLLDVLDELRTLLAGTANNTEAEAAKLRAERQKLQADRKRWNEFDLKTVQRFESERDQARADLAALRANVRALADDLPARTHGVDDAGIATWRERDKVSYKIAIEEAQGVLRALLTDGD